MKVIFGLVVMIAMLSSLICHAAATADRGKGV